MGPDLAVDDLWGRMPPASRELAECAAAIAQELGQTLYLVGGALRDLLMGNGPVDLDLVTEGETKALAAKVAGEFGGRVRSPSLFLTVRVDLPGGRRIDIATARQESYPLPGKLPVVAPADITADLRRRDFSINAMALRLSREGATALVDPCGGRHDLAAGVLRVLHDQSFVEDPTRLIRAARFSARFGFAFEPRTAALIADAVNLRVLDGVSGARVRQEVIKLLSEPSPTAALYRLTSLGVAYQTFAGFRPDDRLWHALSQTPIALATLQVAGRARRSSVRRKWPYLLGVVAAWADTSAVVKRLALDRGAADVVHALAAGMTGPLPPLLTTWSRLSPTELDDTLSDLDCATLIGYWLRVGGQARYRLEEYVSVLQPKRAAIDGHTLQEAGVPSGPAIAVGLTAARQARLEGQCTIEDQVQAAQVGIAKWRRAADVLARAHN